MPIISFKKKFNNFTPIKEDTFIINFNLKYTKKGSLKFKGIISSNYFDSGDYNLLLDEVLNNFNDSVFKKYDNGVFILSICKYLVDNVKNIYSICYESNDCTDIYYRNEIIKDYNKIKKYKRKD